MLTLKPTIDSIILQVLLQNLIIIMQKLILFNPVIYKIPRDYSAGN